MCALVSHTFSTLSKVLAQFNSSRQLFAASQVGLITAVNGPVNPTVHRLSSVQPSFFTPKTRSAQNLYIFSVLFSWGIFFGLSLLVIHLGLLCTWSGTFCMDRTQQNLQTVKLWRRVIIFAAVYFHTSSKWISLLRLIYFSSVFIIPHKQNETCKLYHSYLGITILRSMTKKNPKNIEQNLGHYFNDHSSLSFIYH